MAAASPLAGFTGGRLAPKRAAKLRIMTKKTGTTNWSMVLEPIMPPSTVVPMDWRLLAPAPVAIVSGNTPSMNAMAVIRIGRKR